jgi:acyl dehydratase
MRSFKSIDEMTAALGEELGPSDWVEIEQPRIDAFAQVTGDDQWIHVDKARAAREMPEGRTIAHGFLTLSLIPHLRHQIWHLESTARGINYGLEKVRFPAPVMSGDRVRMRQMLSSIEPAGDGFKIIFTCTVEIEGRDKPACVAETVSIIYERA